MDDGEYPEREFGFGADVNDAPPPAFGSWPPEKKDERSGDFGAYVPSSVDISLFSCSSVSPRYGGTLILPQDN